MPQIMMKSSNKLIVILLFLGLLFAAPNSFSHQQKSAISTILFNSNTQNIEITHRFRIHDAEHAVKQIFGKNADIINSKETKEHFNDYVNQHFSILVDNQPLALTKVGYEDDGKFFWVYQETKEPPMLESLSIRYDALRDIWPSQVNTVNVEGKGKLQTITFSDATELINVHF